MSGPVLLRWLQTLRKDSEQRVKAKKHSSCRLQVVNDAWLVGYIIPVQGGSHRACTERLVPYVSSEIDFVGSSRGLNGARVRDQPLNCMPSAQDVTRRRRTFRDLRILE